MPIGKSAQANVNILFSASGLQKLNTQTTEVLKGLKTRATYYAGMIQARLGYAFIGAGIAIAGFAAMSVKKFAEFDQAMRNTSSVTRATESELVMLSDTSKDLGTIGTKSAIDVANAMYFLGSAGQNVKQIMESINPIMRLATATQSDMSETARITMQTTKAFGMEAKDTEKVVRIFAAGISGSQLRLEWLGQSMKHIGPVAHDMGISLEEVVAALAMLHDTGIQAGMAGRHLRRILQGTLKDTPQVTKVLREYTLTIEDLDIKTIGLAGVFQVLHDKNVKLADIFKIFGLRASASGAVLVRTVGDFQKYLSMVGDATKLQDMFNEQLKGLQAQFKRLANTFQVFMIEFAEPFVPTIRAITETLRGMADWLRKLPDLVKVIMSFGAGLASIVLIATGLRLVLLGLLTQSMLTINTFQALVGNALSLTWAFTKIKIAFASLIIQENLFALSSKALATRMVGVKVIMGAQLITVRNLTMALHGLVLAIAATLAKLVFFVAIGYGIAIIIKKIVWGINEFKRELKKLNKPIEESTKKVGFWGKTWSAIWKKLPIEQKVFINATTASFKALGAAAGDETNFLGKEVGALKKEINEINEFFMNLFGGGTKEEPPFKDIPEKFDAGVKSMILSGKTFFDYMDESANDFGESFKDFHDDLETEFTDTIVGLIDGTKTWLDVWDDTLKSALNIFVHGFVRNMLLEWGSAMSKMVWGGQGSIAGLGGGLWGWIENFLNPAASINSHAVSIIGAVGQGGVADPLAGMGLGISSYAKGIDYVPNDMIAKVHQGEKITPANENRGDITLVNVIDPSFVSASILRDPNTVLNIVNDDLIFAGSTRRTIKRYAR